MIQNYAVEIEGKGCVFVNSDEAADAKAAVEVAKTKLRLPEKTTVKAKVDTFQDGTLVTDKTLKVNNG